MNFTQAGNNDQIIIKTPKGDSGNKRQIAFEEPQAVDIEIYEGPKRQASMKRKAWASPTIDESNFDDSV